MKRKSLKISQSVLFVYKSVKTNQAYLQRETDPTSGSITSLSGTNTSGIFKR